MRTIFLGKLSALLLAIGLVCFLVLPFLFFCVFAEIGINFHAISIVTAQPLTPHTHIKMKIKTVSNEKIRP